MPGRHGACEANGARPYGWMDFERKGDTNLMTLPMMVLINLGIVVILGMIARMAKKSAE
jgi:hypothetical protein